MLYTCLYHPLKGPTTVKAAAAPQVENQILFQSNHFNFVAILPGVAIAYHHILKAGLRCQFFTGSHSHSHPCTLERAQADTDIAQVGIEPVTL